MENDKTMFYIVAIIAIVAVVGMITMVLNVSSGSTKYVASTTSTATAAEDTAGEATLASTMLFRESYGSCYDGTPFHLGGPTSCKPSGLWRTYANNFCKDHYACLKGIEFSSQCIYDTGSISVTEAQGYKQATATCYDGAKIPLIGVSSCQSPATWKQSGEDSCSRGNHCKTGVNTFAVTNICSFAITNELE